MIVQSVGANVFTLLFVLSTCTASGIVIGTVAEMLIGAVSEIAIVTVESAVPDCAPCPMSGSAANAMLPREYHYSGHGHCHQCFCSFHCLFSFRSEQIFLLPLNIKAVYIYINGTGRTVNIPLNSIHGS